MATATAAKTMTIDLPLPECAPPPLPARARRKQRPATLEPGMRIGVWRIERELGRGGMATVYAAVHTRFGKRAALKLAHRGVLGPRFTPETFLREARIANLIGHPGVAEVFATGMYDGRPYLAMERLAGQSLGARLDQGPIPRDEAFAILIELCGVLEAAHAAGVTHRDLKLDNVYLVEGASEGQRVKLLDWGMARIAGETDPLGGLVAGTLSYVAPEQLRGDDVTAAADVYALAVLGYLLLLGQAPFTSRAELEIIHKHLHEAPPAPRTLWADVPRELEATLLAMLSKVPAQRPALAEVVRVLRAARAQLQVPVEVQAPPRRSRWFPALVAPTDVIGRPALALLATPQRRIASAALGLALTVASALMVFSG